MKLKVVAVALSFSFASTAQAAMCEFTGNVPAYVGCIAGQAWDALDLALSNEQAIDDLARSGRTVRVEDGVTGCPPTRAASDVIMLTEITLARDGDVVIQGDIIGRGVNRHDLLLYVDGDMVDQTLTYSYGTAWVDAHVGWTGTLTAGTHDIWVQGPSANMWGCGPSWGSIDVTIFD
jgi:hypothetical protein